jgi:hypothetical protein
MRLCQMIASTTGSRSDGALFVGRASLDHKIGEVEDRWR